LARSKAPKATEARQLLVRLSGRLMKRGVEFTEPALLAGMWVLLAMLDTLEEYTPAQLRRQAVGPDSQGDAAEGLGMGNPERILRAMKKWEEVGVDRVNFLLNCMEEIPQEQVLQSLRLFAQEVMPHFRKQAAPAAVPVGSVTP